MASAELTKTIIDLISQKHEGPYWDFKRQWYDEEHKGNLLHDIICMANNLVNRDAYIIIGVDEENDYAPYDIFDDKNKRSTQQLTDFLLCDVMVTLILFFERQRSKEQKEDD